jgi:hypothetical protein
MLDNAMTRERWAWPSAIGRPGPSESRANRGTARWLGVNIFHPIQFDLYFRTGTQFGVRDVDDELEFAAWLTLIVVGLALLH